MIKNNKKLAKFYGSLGFKFINNDNKLKLEDVNKETSEKNLNILLEILSGPRRTVTQPTYHIEVMYYMKTYIIHLLRNCNVTINYLE
jgi:hypothetical protein